MPFSAVSACDDGNGVPGACPAGILWSRRTQDISEARLGHVNGEPAVLRWMDGRLQSITTIVMDDEGRITELFSVLNPDKLRGLL